MKTWPKDLNRHFTKKDVGIVHEHMKDAQHHYSLRKCRWKPHGDTTALWTTLTTPSAGRRWSNPPTVLAGVQYGTVPLGNGLAISYKVEHTLIAWARNPTSGDLPREIKACVHRKIWTQIFIVLFTITTSWQQPEGPSARAARPSTPWEKRKTLFTCAAQRNLDFIS